MSFFRFAEVPINSDFFVLAAQLAVTIAGFSGIVVALEARGVRSWTPLRRRKLRILLQLSALALLFSIVPLVTYRLADNSGYWRWALGLYGLVHLADISTFLFRQPEGAWRGPVYPGVAFAIFQLAVAAMRTGWEVETVYMVSVAWHVAGAAMGFVFLIWGEPNEYTPMKRVD